MAGVLHTMFATRSDDVPISIPTEKLIHAVDAS